MSERDDMPAALIENDYLIAANACLQVAIDQRTMGNKRNALRYAVTSLKLFAHIEGFNRVVEAGTLDLYDIIEACSVKRKEPDAVIQDTEAAQP